MSRSIRVKKRDEVLYGLTKGKYIFLSNKYPMHSIFKFPDLHPRQPLFVLVLNMQELFDTGNLQSINHIAVRNFESTLRSTCNDHNYSNSYAHRDFTVQDKREYEFLEYFKKSMNKTTLLRAVSTKCLCIVWPG